MELIAAALTGVAIGVVTGIAPGIHVNLVSALLLSLFPIIPLSPPACAVFIISLAVAHTFFDSIPCVYLGAPDASQALGVLPGHRYLLKGQGLMAIKLSIIGALGGLLLGAAVFTLFARFATWSDAIPQKAIGYVLLSIPLVMIIRDKQHFAAGVIAVTASMYGIIGLRYPDPLFPMLSGMFGTATLLYSILEKTNIPSQQDMPTIAVRWRDAARALIGGVIAGGLTAILPGVGAAHASVIGMLLASGTGDHGFLILTGAIGTTNFFLSLAAYDAIGKARNGAMLAATTIAPTIAPRDAFGAAFIAGGLGAIGTIFLARRAGAWLPRIPYTILSASVIIFVSTLVLVLAGGMGFVLYVTGIAIGLMPAASRAGRAHGMCCLLVPIGLRFVGVPL